jgi:hypothetical protein
MRGSRAKTGFRLQLETLEDRLVPSATLPDVDLSTKGSVGAINDAIFRQVDAQPTGTGYIDSFVRLQAANAKSSVEQGFNTDGPLQFDENKSRNFTRSLSLGDVPEVNLGGVRYREFLLDINQKSSQPFLSLDELRFFVGGAPDLTGYNAATRQLAGLDAVYDMDAGGDHWVKLNVRLNPGSGKGDMLLYVPSQLFGSDPSAFVYLYSKFGVNISANSGFEEWAVGESASSLACDNNTIIGTVRDFDGNPMADVTIFLDANDNGLHDSDEVYTTTDYNGQYAFHNLASGFTYRVRQIVREGYTQVGEDPAPVNLAHCTDVATIVDFLNMQDVNEQPGES